MFEFRVLKRDKNSLARTGIIETPHGIVETPAYTMVGTNAAVRTLSSNDLTDSETQMVIVNTYHMWKDLGGDLQNFEGLHRKMQWEKPLMTDSGGFQVFSFGFGREHGIGKVKKASSPSGNSAKNIVKIAEEGVYFYDDKERFLSPEISMDIQEKLGADIIFAFDECTSPLNDYEYTKESMERTHRWAERCLVAKKIENQALYGIVQGGEFRNLRERSATQIGHMPFQGFGIGGSFGKLEMLDVLEWTIPLLPIEKPKHLLGIGRIEDIFEGVKRGIDTFDCVIPTREARHGSLWTKIGRFDVRKGRYADDTGKIEEDCSCPVCSKGILRGELHNLFKSKDLSAGRLATIHNVYFFNNLMGKIRISIREGKFEEVKKEYLGNN